MNSNIKYNEKLSEQLEHLWHTNRQAGLKVLSPIRRYILSRADQLLRGSPQQDDAQMELGAQQFDNMTHI